MHLKHWHRATRGADGDLLLSSFELLETIDFLPDDGPFKSAAVRGNRWPIMTEILAEIANEQYRMRSSFLAANTVDGEGWFDTKPFEFADPMVRVKQLREEESKTAAVERSQNDFEAQIGFVRTDQEG